MSLPHTTEDTQNQVKAEVQKQRHAMKTIALWVNFSVFKVQGINSMNKKNEPLEKDKIESRMSCTKVMYLTVLHEIFIYKNFKCFSPI